MADRIRIRRDTAANWASANPTLLLGEAGWETDTGKVKFGNGTSAWNSLTYAARSFIWKGAYSSATAYKQNDVVSYQGQSYICILDSTNVAPTVTSSWELMAAKGSDGTSGTNGTNGVSFVWKGTYSNSVSYAVNDCVYYSGTAYICTQANTAILPTTITHWDTLAAKGTNGTNGQGLTWRDAYNGSVAYSILDAVSYNGSSYVCTAASSGNLPTNSSFWALMASKGDTGATGAAGATGATGAAGANGTSFIWKAAYSASTSYAVNDVVSYNGSAYVCVSAALNIVPTTTQNWNLLASKGDTGATGPAGTVTVVAGTTSTVWTATANQTTFAGINGYTTTDKGAYLVSVGGIDQTVDNYSITSANGGSLVLSSGVVVGTVVSVRAVVGVAASGNATQLQGRALAATAPTDGQAVVWDATGSTWKPGTVSGGSGNATQLQGRNVASTAPTTGQVLAWNGTAWVPSTAGSGTSITLTSPGTHVLNLATSTLISVVATAGDGSAGTDGADGNTDGTNGTDGIDGDIGRSITFFGRSVDGGSAGNRGWGGGGVYRVSETGGNYWLGLAGNGPCAGQGGNLVNGGNGGCGAENGHYGDEYGDGLGGIGLNNGGNGGNGSVQEDPRIAGNGGGGGANGSGGGGGASWWLVDIMPEPGQGGQGTPGGTGETFMGTVSVAAGTHNIVITEGAGTASITISW